ncbi:MAG: peroxiredoxin [Candidatus Hydrogenedentes bacterium]|nr:peroxiredoxin [Candidatus Hydrogenedentota bacterium]
MVTRSWLAFVAVVVAVPFVCAAQGDSSSKLKAGDDAPDFAVPEQKAVPDAPKKVSELEGKKNVLIAFYPKADTPGCTKQLCGYRDEIQTYQSANTEIIAVSIDQQMDSEKFQDKFKLPFPVVGDPQHKIIEAYGVPMKDVAGNKFAQRSVFLVDKQGKVRYIDIDYRIAEDKDALYDQIESIEGGAEEKTQ